MLGVRNDAELNELLKHVHISHGGVLPCIHPALLKRKGGITSSSSAQFTSNISNSSNISSRQQIFTGLPSQVSTS